MDEFMIHKKEFYFVRHGQTDHNLIEGKEKSDHTAEIPLNTTGKSQAIAIEPIIANLPIQTICCSPMLRAQETKQLITPRLQVPHVDIEDLGECTAKIWREMSGMGMYYFSPHSGEARFFIERVRRGINQALALPGPSLIIAHGGVHWALCSLLGIDTHEWRLQNCGIVHFFINSEQHWAAKKLS